MTGLDLAALHDPEPPVPGAAARVAVGRRARRLRRARRARAAGAAVLAGVVAAAVLVAVRDDGRRNRVEVVDEDTVAPGMPAQAVAVTDDGRVVVLDAATGAEVRELARGASTTVGLPHLAVSPDGTTVLFERTAVADGCSPYPVVRAVDEIAVVAVAGGSARPLARGARPAWSPDGRWIAFAAREHGDDGCGPPDAVVVHDAEALLASGAATDTFGRWFPRLAPGSPLAPSGSIFSLAWAPDSRHVVVGVDAAGTYPRVLDTDAGAGTVLEDAPRVPIGDATTVALSYLGTTGRLLGVSDLDPDGGSLTANGRRARVVAIDPSTGVVERVLFEIDNVAGEPLVADPTGRHVLAVVTVDAGEDRGDTALLRWSEGEPEPTTVARGIVAAAWLPA